MSPRAPVAQLDRATGFEPVGRGFDSLRARHFFLDHHTASTKLRAIFRRRPMLVLSRIGASSLQVLVDRVLICYA